MRTVFFDKHVSQDMSEGIDFGMYKAKLIAETMGGEILLKPAEKQTGTTIIIRIPKK
jgi:K+-sensing histidine kinase KdpD